VRGINSNAEKTVQWATSSFVILSKCIIWMIKSKNMRWVWHVAGTDEKRDACFVLVGKPGRKAHMGDQSKNLISGRMF